MSSKKQEIADSWEDIDEEQLANAITILKNSTSVEGDKVDSSKSYAASGTAARQNTLPQMLEEELRPRIVARPMQILKRPQTSGGSEGKSAADSKPKTQIKSFDQRKEEYAKARLRILGSAHDDEEAETKKTTPTTNGYRINNVNNNVGSSGNASSNASSTSGGSGGGSGGVVSGDGIPGNGANNNSNNMYRYHPPYRQLPSNAIIPTAKQKGPQGRGQGAPVVYYPTTPNLHHHHHHPHHPMQSTHPLHPHHTFPPMPHHHHLLTQQPHQQQPHGSHPYQHQQHFAQLNHQQPGGRDSGWYVGGRNGGNLTVGYYGGGGSQAYGEGNGGPLLSPLLGHAPPGAIPNHAMSYNGGQPNAHGSSGGSNITTTNQHVLRLPAGPDGSQGFNMRR
ncbi:protein pygopus [Anopheles maculipalpis]|uniref:protein pygopus n=1 Tax=Anopheles maculipalpis TaxID=1496333 RepID=UPI002158C2FB|nr:protein pygopus [Anopheles maculipalpis]XP_050077901.1 protein pygopus [Anopheles maculipalpis]